jgi:hypothetical protein
VNRCALGLLALAAGVLALGLLLRFGPALTFSVALAAPRLDSWLARVGQPSVRESVALPVEGRTLEADTRGSLRSGCAATRWRTSTPAR